MLRGKQTYRAYVQWGKRFIPGTRTLREIRSEQE